MCARFALFRLNLVETIFKAEPLTGFPPQYNIAATDVVQAVMVRDGKRRVWPLQWGLVPGWSNDHTIGSRLLNARAETVAEKPSFRGALKYRRCLIPADGFFEWKGEKGAKQPYYIHPSDGGQFAFAGLWETWERPEGYLETCTIITTEPNRKMGELHNRMPVILSERDWSRWLNPKIQDSREIMDLLQPCASSQIEYYPVGKEVGNVRAEGPHLLERVDIEPGTLF